MRIQLKKTFVQTDEYLFLKKKPIFFKSNISPYNSMKLKNYFHFKCFHVFEIPLANLQNLSFQFIKENFEFCFSER